MLLHSQSQWVRNIDSAQKNSLFLLYSVRDVSWGDSWLGAIVKRSAFGSGVGWGISWASSQRDSSRAVRDLVR